MALNVLEKIAVSVKLSGRSIIVVEPMVHNGRSCPYGHEDVSASIDM